MCFTDFGTVFLVLGITTVVGSIFSVTIQASATALVLTSSRWMNVSGYVSAGVWCGALFCATGVMSIVLGKRLRNPYTSSRSHTGLLGGVLGMSVTSLIFSITLFAFGIVASFELNSRTNLCMFPNSYQYGYNSYRTTTPSPYRNCFDGSFGMGVVLTLIAMTQFAISVASIIYSSRLLCCRSRVTGPDDLRVTYNSQPTLGFPQSVVYMMPVPTGNYGAPGAYAPQMNAGYVLPPINLVPNPVYVAAQPIATTTQDAVRSPPSYGDANQPVLEEPFSSEHGNGRYAKL